MIKALIIDDDFSVANVLQFLIERHVPEINDLRIATTISEAKSLILQFQPDLVFQDIIMPEMNGFEFLSQLNKINFDLIFTTAYNEYAIRAIRFSALDYLLKPINPQELRFAIDRFLEKRKQQQETNALLKNLISNLEQKKETAFRLAIPTVDGALFFSPSDIIRLEGERNYTRFYLANQQKILSAKTMKEYEDILLQQGFLRIHKSHLVNRSYIKSFHNEGMVILSDESTLPVSRLRRAEIAAVLKR